MEVSRGTTDALVSSIIKSLRIASNGRVNSELLILLIRSFGYLKGGLLKGKLKAIDLDGFDIFTPLLNCDGVERKLDFAAILLAYCSINKELQPLITMTIEKWYNLVPRAENDDNEFRPGYFTIVSEFGMDEKIDHTLARLSKFNLAGVLANSWIPQWLSFVAGKGSVLKKDMASLDLTSLALFEHNMDFYIATMDFSILNSKCLTNRSYESPEAYFFFKICQRLILFPGWIEKTPYRIISKFLLSSGNKTQDGKLNEVSFSLEILLEIVDHPDVNYLEEPKLVTLLFLSLKKIYQTPCNKLHLRLGSLGTTHSLTALLSMVQYLLSKFLINTGSISELAQETKMDVQLMQANDESWYKSSKDTAKLPAWFDSSILPPTAPIPKSSFVYDKENWREHASTCIIQISDMLIESLNITLLINAKILSEYRELGINTLAFNEESDGAHEIISTIEHRVTEQYMQLYFIPLFSSLMLSKQLSSGGSKVYDAKKYFLKGDVIFSNSVELCRKILQAHTGIALYHLTDFISKISLEGLLLQSISVDVLNCLLFTEEDNFVKTLVLENQLSQQALKLFVNDWDDGSEKYRRFHEQLFLTKQSNRQTNLTTVLDLIKLLPDREAILHMVTQNTPNIESQIQVLSNGAKRKPTPRTNSYVQGSKFDPYSATSFVPASKAVSNPAKELSTFTEQASPQGQRQMTPDPWPNFLTGSSNELSSHEQLNMYVASGSSDPANTPLTEQMQHTLNFHNISSLTSTPNTPNISTSTMFSNPWDGSPSIHSTPNVSRIVNTGKNYILGGHNRIKNNSRAQSIHIDNFEQL